MESPFWSFPMSATVMEDTAPPDEQVNQTEVLVAISCQPLELTIATEVVPRRLSFDVLMACLIIISSISAYILLAWLN